MSKYSKTLVFFLSLWPIYVISYQIIFNQLGPEPVDRIINHFGEWTLIFILLTLSMTPLKKITKSAEWIKFRRMLGLFTFFYASIHMLSYVGLDYRFDFEPLINDVLKKKFIFIGFSAWLLLIPLAVTSSERMVRLLKQNWKKIHRLIYIIGIFGVLHYIWLSKTIFFKPLIFLIILVILLLFRIKITRSASKIWGFIKIFKRFDTLSFNKICSIFKPLNHKFCSKLTFNIFKFFY